ncbi:MAG: response regulator [Candidatus Omnitrophica bacterium]|nr:response regulator [Candidatus Omnitrophota bacterium]
MGVENILVVDDEPLMGRAFQRTLAVTGHNVDSVLSGAAAVEAVKKKRYAMAFIDQNMPGMSGIETCQALKKIDPEIKTVYITGLFSKENVLLEQQFVEPGGVTYYLYKPFAKGEILAVVLKALGSERSQAQSS